MNAMDLLNKTQKQFVSSDTMSSSISVTYTHISGVIVEDLRVLKEEATFNDSTKAKGVISTTSFYNVFLDEEPTNNDTILCDGKTYKVDEWEGLSGMWIIHTTSNKRHSLTHRK